MPNNILKLSSGFFGKHILEEIKMENGMKAKDFLAVNNKLKKTNEDTTPFLVSKDEELIVVGDANQIEVKSNDYTIKFRMSKDEFETKPEGAEEIGHFYVFSLVYEGISITPRSDLKIVDAIFKILPFFNELKEDGDIEDLSREELLSLFANAKEEIHLAMYNLVATFLGIDDHLGAHMLPFSVIGALSQLIDNHPEIFNEADVFFG